jgi:hypothetical protein
VHIWANVSKKVDQNSNYDESRVGSNIHENGPERPQNIVFVHIWANVSQKVDQNSNYGESQVGSNIHENGPE